MAGADWDVIVIGGGFCGVTAARECQKAGLRTVEAGVVVDASGDADVCHHAGLS